MTSLLSTTEAMAALNALSTRSSAEGRSNETISLSPSARTFCPTLSLDQPNWRRMIDGGLPSSTPRRSENAASSAVSGLPGWNFSPGRVLEPTFRPAVGRSLPTLGGTGDDLPESARVVLHQPQVEVVQRVAGGNLERLLRIEREESADVARDHERVRRRGGVRAARRHHGRYHGRYHGRHHGRDGHGFQGMSHRISFGTQRKQRVSDAARRGAFSLQSICVTSLVSR